MVANSPMETSWEIQEVCNKHFFLRPPLSPLPSLFPLPSSLSFPLPSVSSYPLIVFAVFVVNDPFYFAAGTTYTIVVTSTSVTTTGQFALSILGSNSVGKYSSSPAHPSLSISLLIDLSLIFLKEQLLANQTGCLPVLLAQDAFLAHLLQQRSMFISLPHQLLPCTIS